VQEVAVELDHVIVFVAGPEAVAPLLPGFVLDPGIRHGGQGLATGESFSRRAGDGQVRDLGA
jgi:hypothetical protein